MMIGFVFVKESRVVDGNVYSLFGPCDESEPQICVVFFGRGSEFKFFFCNNEVTFTARRCCVVGFKVIIKLTF